MYLHLIRAQNERCAVVEVHTDATIRKRIAHAVLVAVVHPAHDEHSFVGQRKDAFGYTEDTANSLRLEGRRQRLRSSIETI